MFRTKTKIGFIQKPGPGPDPSGGGKIIVFPDKEIVRIKVKFVVLSKDE